MSKGKYGIAKIITIVVLCFLEFKFAIAECCGV